MLNHEAVNYRLRPAKGAERKMLCEIMARLSVFGRLEEYLYIGFGSIYFTDYLLFHRILGINNMHSIEQEITDEPDEFTVNRYEFNRPYSCVNIHFGTATEHLPRMPWRTGKAIVWLDYVKGLKNDFIHDLRIATQRALPGSFLLITVNVEAETLPGATPEQQEAYRYKQLTKRLNGKYIPAGTDKKALSTPELVELYHGILTGVINESLNARNGLAKEENKIVAHQVVNIQYADGPTMVTFGWILVSKKDTETFDKAGFKDIGFYRPSFEPFVVSIPNLTIKELGWLESMIHSVRIDDDDNVTYESIIGKAPALDAADIRMYRQIYRYFPTFAEAIL
ncbi:O-methyltransferase [Hymenobacter pini]|uniref:O-methyltransferase n=1 Tax=Hymenobacter pini TaxID=2880879 RepID=UPI001CF1559B|nr:O-methyltransferase [Hymenobacter pini]MCA8830509.1 hypothetical protein [Hymenobacter pini]